MKHRAHLSRIYAIEALENRAMLTDFAFVPHEIPNAIHDFVRDLGLLHHADFADVNDDGNIDMVSLESGQLRLHLSEGTGIPIDGEPFGSPIPDATRFNGIRIADLDGDAHLDVGFFGAGRDNLYWVPSIGFDQSPIERYPAAERPHTNFRALIDANGDGRLDAFIAQADESVLFYSDILNGGPIQTLVEPFTFGGNGIFAPHIHAADLDSDGDIDFVVFDEVAAVRNDSTRHIFLRR